MTDPILAIGQMFALLAGLGSGTAEIGRIDRAMTDAAGERAAMSKLVRGLAVVSIEAAPGIVEIPPHLGGTGPVGGGQLPASVGSAVDRFGNPVAYCPARVGSFAAAGNRIGRSRCPSPRSPARPLGVVKSYIPPDIRKIYFR